MSGNIFHLGTLVGILDKWVRWLRWLGCGLGLIVWSGPLWANLDDTLTLKIEPQNISDALIELGTQAEISIIFSASLPFTGTSPSLNGTYTPRQALNLLLTDQNVEWQAFNSRVIAINSTPEKTPIQPVLTPQPLSEIVIIGEQVTGSRLKRLDLEGSAPVDIITESEIAASGVQAVADYLRFIPAVSGNSTSTAVSNGGDGTATITLRGLPSANTLVLLDGRRTANSGFGGDSVDLNSIPLAAVERIEVLKDGASAIYGSDAIAGVVNIIFKKEFEGLLLDQYVSQTRRGDLNTSHTSIVGGFSRNNTHVMLSLSHFDQDPIYSRDRELSENADGRLQGGVDSRSSATPFSRITLPNDPNNPDDDQTVVLRDEFSDPNQVSSYRAATLEDRYNFRESTSSMSPSQRSAAYASLVQDVGDYSQWTTQAGYTETEAQVTFAPYPLFTLFEDPPLITSAQNPFNPFGVDIPDIRRRIIELGPRLQTSKEMARRFNTVWETFVNNVHWDVAYIWSTTRADEEFKGIINLDRTQHALSADCLTDTDCVPLNLFGPPGSIDQAQLDYLRVVDNYGGISRLAEITTNADTIIEDWFADPLSVAGGISYRRENAKLEPDSNSFGNTKPPTINGDRSIFEAYFEANIPLLAQKRFAYQLELEIASRYSHYSDFGDTNNPKMGLRYRPISSLLLRSTWSRGFRAPSLNQLNQGEKFSFDFLDDPCQRPDNVGVLPGCSLQADDTIRQFLVATGGNKDLQPETSVTKTLGFVWTPRGNNELYFSVDGFWIEQKDIIDSRPQFIVDQNAQFLRFQDQIIRDAQGNILRIVASNLNVGSLDVNGIDATIRYRLLNKPIGNLVYSFNASHIANYEQKLSPITPIADLSGTFADQASDGAGAIPKLKLNTGMSWSNKRWEVNYNIFFVDEIEESIPFSSETRTITSWTTHNAQLNFVPDAQMNIRLTLGIDNIFDRLPPFSASAFNDNYDPRTYEIKGRNWYGQFRYQF